jgi:hypothetical protein
MSPSNISLPVEDFKKKITDEDIVHNELAENGPKDYDDLDLQEHGSIEPDDSQLLMLKPPLTLPTITSKLTPIERLWLADMIKAHGEELVLAQWPVYEVHINYVRYLLKLQ